MFPVLWVAEMVRSGVVCAETFVATDKVKKNSGLNFSEFSFLFFFISKFRQLPLRDANGDLLANFRASNALQRPV